MNKALFLDRDGVINKNFGHVHKIENFKFRKGIFELVKIFQDRGYIIIVVTNQAGIGKGKYSIDQFNILNNWMISQFIQKDLHIEKTYFCPHKPEDNCICRKPNPGMLLIAIKEFNLDTNSSFFIGDKDSDIISGKLAQIKHLFKVEKSLLVLTRKLNKTLSNISSYE